jgi:hypothetical protein
MDHGELIGLIMFLPGDDGRRYNSETSPRLYLETGKTPRRAGNDS